MTLQNITKQINTTYDKLPPVTPSNIFLQRPNQSNRSFSVNSSKIDYSFLKNNGLKENYSIDDLCEEDGTDDEDEPRKPIPEWAKTANVLIYGKRQAKKVLNYTKLFKSSCEQNIQLENVFKESKYKFHARSSSADWSSPPVWGTKGIN